MLLSKNIANEAPPRDGTGFQPVGHPAAG